MAKIRSFLRTNETPIYLVSATAFNLLGIDRWVRNFKFLNYYDPFDGTHPNVFVPSTGPSRPEQARATRTFERERCILDLLARPETNAVSFEDAFLRPPLSSTAHDSGFGTLFTAAYRPAERSVDYRWPSFSWRLRFDAFAEAEHTELLAEGAVA